jgi:cytochrome c oxidase subunit 2
MRRGAWKHCLLGLASLAAAAPAMAVPVDGGIDFQRPVTELAKEVHEFHIEILVIITVITAFVTALLLWVIVRYNKKANPTPRKFSHNTLVEILWTVIPVIILVVIAYRSFPLLYKMDVFPTEVTLADGTKRPISQDEIVDIKIYGHQWRWGYIYGSGDTAVEFDSNMIPDADIDPAKGQITRLSVDNPMVAPVGKFVRLSITASDVIHAWAMPQFAIKVDAVPGRLNQLWFNAQETGIYYGQCSELCGQSHSAMPIELRVVTQQHYEEWLRRAATSMTDAKAYLDQVAPAPPQPAKVASAN